MLYVWTYAPSFDCCFLLGLQTSLLMSVMWHALFRSEFKINHEEWIKSVKPKLGSNASEDVLAAIKTSYDDIKTLYKVRMETRIALKSLLKVSPISCCVP